MTVRQTLDFAARCQGPAFSKPNLPPACRALPSCLWEIPYTRCFSLVPFQDTHIKQLVCSEDLAERWQQVLCSAMGKVPRWHCTPQAWSNASKDFELGLWNSSFNLSRWGWRAEDQGKSYGHWAWLGNRCFHESQSSEREGAQHNGWLYIEDAWLGGMLHMWNGLSPLESQFIVAPLQK